MIDKELFLDRLREKVKELQKEFNIGLAIEGYSGNKNSDVFTLTATYENNENYELFLCKSIGLKHNVFGIEFKYQKESFRLTNILPNKRKYKIVAINTKGQSMGFPVDFFIKLVGEENIKMYKRKNVLKEITERFNDKE